MIKSILIVDDQSEVRELVSVTLEIGDYQILTAENGYQALEQIRAHRPDLVLLDVMMPGGPDGLEICRQIKSQYATSGVYVIMLTAKGQEADQRAGFEAGANDYFIKPFSPLELIQKLEAVLDRRA